jgi:excisionase family DNA binding protein
MGDFNSYILQMQDYFTLRSKKMVTEDKNLSISMGCEYLGIKKTKFYELLKAGAIKTFKIGSRRLVRLSELERFVNQASGEV